MRTSRVKVRSLVYPEANVHQSSARPLSCPGLTLRRHPLTSTPMMGLRAPTAPILPLDPWTPPMRGVEFSLQRPFESGVFTEPASSSRHQRLRSSGSAVSSSEPSTAVTTATTTNGPPAALPHVFEQSFVIGGRRPDSFGHFSEPSADGSTPWCGARHATLELQRHLSQAEASRPTEWANRLQQQQQQHNASCLFLDSTGRVCDGNSNGGGSVSGRQLVEHLAAAAAAAGGGGGGEHAVLVADNRSGNMSSSVGGQKAHKRLASYRLQRLAAVKELNPASRLFVPTSLTSCDAAVTSAIREDLACIRRQRRRHQIACSGKDAASKRKQIANAVEQERLRVLRERDVQEHVRRHDNSVLAYRIAFDKFDEDGSGSIDALELKAALHYLGLEIAGHNESATVIEDLLDKYDTDGSGSLDFAEFAMFAKDALLDPASKSVFLSKKAMKNGMCA